MFATKVVIIDMKDRLNASMANTNLQSIVQREINADKIDIDRECFRKTLAEKAELKIAKVNWRAHLRKGGLL